MTTTALQFRTYSTHLGRTYRADGETYSYTIAREPMGWTITVWRQQPLAGMVTLGDKYEATFSTLLADAKAIVRHYEDNVDADTKPSQNRMTRAIGRAYDEEN